MAKRVREGQRGGWKGSQGCSHDVTNRMRMTQKKEVRWHVPELTLGLPRN